MTAVPQPTPVSLLTIEDYAALDETESGYTELVEGRLLMSPSPGADHNAALLKLATQLQSQLPENLEVLPDLDVDLELVEPHKPGFSRRPDLVVARRAARQRIRAEGGILRASETVLVVEIVSPGSRRTDYVTKRGEYADAGTPHYWIVDIDPPVSLLACHLAAEFGYQDTGETSGVFTATEPFEARIQLDELVR